MFEKKKKELRELKLHAKKNLFRLLNNDLKLESNEIL